MIDVINISGKKFAGKDFVTNHIKDVVKDRPVLVYRWADPLKIDLLKMYNALGEEVTLDELNDNSNPNKARHTAMMQAYGTDYRRAADYDYWVKRGLDAIRGLLKAGLNVRPLVVINDSRFGNEMDWPKKLEAEGYVVRSIRLTVSKERQYERAARNAQPFDESKRLHRSEIELDSYPTFDYTVDSNRALELVYADIDQILINNGFSVAALV